MQILSLIHIFTVGQLTLEHVQRFHDELDAAGIHNDAVSPKLLPNYTRHGDTI